MKRLPFRTPADAARAIEIVRNHLAGGGILAYPTETVYGLGCALDRDALDTLAALKGRDAMRPFLLLHHDPHSLAGLVWTRAADALAEEFWPGPLTLALAADNILYRPPVLSPEYTVGVRHSPLLPLDTLLKAIDAPITSTSANNAGERPAVTADEVEFYFGDVNANPAAADADFLLLDGGPTAATLPSTVVDCAGPVPRLVREGAVPLDALRAALNSRGYTIDV